MFFLSPFEAVNSGGLKGLLEHVETEDPSIPALEIPKATTICKVCKALREPDRPLFETVSTLRVIND